MLTTALPIVTRGQLVVSMREGAERDLALEPRTLCPEAAVIL
ncbi:MAG TPA: hypothetical protein PJ994_05370 [Tepidiformaceae bacterium]|nr:hypothetical protein [Tepidiformaceae bacterium]HMO94480.1 hypothetical protein [Tepidiformaceae bacterium]